jgi:four helix bundle protein
VHWKNLEVWKAAHEMVLEIYKVTAAFPKAESFGISYQLRRAAYSIPANIVEGQSRSTTRGYLQFLYNSRGSLEEVRYFLLLSKDLGHLKQEVYATLEQGYEHVSRLLNALIRSLKQKDK